MNDTPRTNRFYASFADGECIPNQDEWLALCESLESELTAARQEIDMLKSKYADHHAEAERLTSEINAVTEQRDRLAEALKLIATWHSYDELHDDVIECEDFAFGYDVAIKISRKALQSLTTNEL